MNLTLKLRNFKNFKKNRTLMKTVVESQFEVTLVYEFQAKANSTEDIC